MRPPGGDRPCDVLQRIRCGTSFPEEPSWGYSQDGEWGLGVQRLPRLHPPAYL